MIIENSTNQVQETYFQIRLKKLYPDYRIVTWDEIGSNPLTGYPKIAVYPGQCVIGHKVYMSEFVKYKVCNQCCAEIKEFNHICFIEILDMMKDSQEFKDLVRSLI